MKFAEEKGRFFTAFHNNLIPLNENSILEKMKDVAGERDLQERAGELAPLRIERFLKGTKREMHNEESGTTETKSSHELEDMENAISQRH